MKILPRCLGALTLMLAAGLASGTAQTVDPTTTTTTPTIIPSGAVAQDPPKISDPGTRPTTTDQNVAADMVHTDSKGRHFAPRGTFYMLSYVAVKTDKGVEGFDPGQEVHFVEAHQDTHTLVVTDGRAQVEVPPSKLTNDMDIAAMVRRNDQAGQTQIAAYVQAEAAAYAKAERDAADATAKDLEHRKEEQAAQDAKVAQAQATPQNTAQTAAAGFDAGYSTNNNGGYYDNGGYGYGNPYSYFVNRPINAGPSNNSSTGSGTVAPSQAGQSKVTAPAGGTAGRTAAPAGRPK